MDGLGGQYAKCSKSDRKTNTLYYLNVESKKYNKLVIIVKKKKKKKKKKQQQQQQQTHRFREQTSDYQCGEGMRGAAIWG